MKDLGLALPVLGLIFASAIYVYMYYRMVDEWQDKYQLLRRDNDRLTDWIKLDKQAWCEGWTSGWRDRSLYESERKASK